MLICADAPLTMKLLWLRTDSAIVQHRDLK
jgi:hypothetical protein